MPSTQKSSETLTTSRPRTSRSAGGCAANRDYAWHQDWLGFLRRAAAAGTQVQRVRLASVPHSDYIRWGLDVSPLNIKAGEDIRYLPRHLTAGIELPEEDYWRILAGALDRLEARKS